MSAIDPSPVVVRCPAMDNEELVPMTYLDLAWEDILFTHILPRLCLKDLFHLRQVSWDNLKLVSAYFAQLKVIDLSDISAEFSDASFKILTENCKSLRKLCLGEAQSVTDDTLTKLFRVNKQLTYLELTGCSTLTGRCILALAVNCKRLTTLRLGRCPWMSRGMVDTILAHLHGLRDVDFSSCQAVTNQQLAIFFQKFSRLTKLSLGYVHAVNDATLISLARNCRDLEYLDIQSCMGITDNGIRAIAEYCLKLKTLKVSNCQLVTEFSLQSFRRNRSVNIDRQVTHLGLEFLRIPIPGFQI